MFLAVVATGMLSAGAPVAASAPSVARKASVDRRLSTVESRARAARGREAVLSSEVGADTTRVRSLEVRLAPLAVRREIAEAKARTLTAELDRLNQRLAAENKGLADAKRLIGVQRAALGARLRELYRRGETSPIVLMLESRSITQVVATNSALNRITQNDRTLIRTVANYAVTVRSARDRIAILQNGVRIKDQRAEAGAAAARAASASLERQTAELRRARDHRRVLLRRIGAQREDLEVEAKGLRSQSLKLANEIIRASGGPVAAIGPPSAAGLVWPVNAPITSGFGFRWGRMHEGVDLGVPEGTPIAAAAAGKVIVSGWQGGYGNLVVVDHGNGLATAYGHQSRTAVSVGQEVAQGSIIGYSGNTGHSTGPHLHFEVRVNGQATNPLAYL